MVKVHLLLLAAGASRRMGEPKQILPWGSETLIEHQINTLLASGKNVSVVLGANSKPISKVIQKLPVTIFINEAWNKGIGSSIASGVKQLLTKDPMIDGILIALIDQPLITTSHFSKMLKLFRLNKKQIIGSRSHKGWVGAPVLFDSFYFMELQKLKGDDGAKTLIGKYADALLTVEGGNLLSDIDTPETYKNMLNRIKNTDKNHSL